ncbi:MAG TPA: tetratricopeptide repeat protein [Elusimicrobiales bacterium]|nr:tetratricopeptide repeat protein [Elusimicrobiales bacterium]
MPGIPDDKELPSWLMPAAVTLFTFLVFLPALKNGFVDLDDVFNFTENPGYRGLGWQQLKWMFTTSHMGPYQPLSWVTLGLDYLVWGMNPFGYHLTNIILHSLNALVFYFLCLKLLALTVRPGAEKAGGLGLAAGFAALFFAVHPLRVESVAWVTERRDVLSGLFYLLTLLWYINPRSAGGENMPPWRRHLLPLAAFLLSLLSKGMAISLPVVLVVLDIYPLRRLPGDPRLWRSREARPVWLEKVPYLMLAAVFAFTAYVFQARVGAIVPCEKAGWAARVAQVFFAAFFYVQKTLLPLGLSPYYKLPDTFSLLSPLALFYAAALAAFTAGAFKLRRRWPAGLAVWVCYLVTLAPVSGLVKIGTQSAADRYTYLPCLGFAALAGAGLLSARRAAVARAGHIGAAAGLLIACLAGLAWRQQGVWLNSETLWTRVYRVDPKLGVAHSDLCGTLAGQGRLAEALEHCRLAVQLNPELALAHYNLGVITAAQGDAAAAVRHYEEALRLNPRSAEAHANLGVILAAQGKAEEAAGQYRAALAINPNLTETYNNLGILMAAQGRVAEAEKYYWAALRVDPNLSLTHYSGGLTHYNLGVLMAAQGKLDAAARHYRLALRVNPDSAETQCNLGLVLAMQGKFEDAAAHYREALRLKPGFALAYYNLGAVQAAQGRLADAEGYYREAIRLSPGFALAHYNLGIVLNAQGKTAAAAGHYREALKIDPFLKAHK